MAISKSIQDRFWSKVDRRGPDDCWLWTAGKSSHGYGSFHIWEKENWKDSVVMPHRVSLAMTSGLDMQDIAGWLVLHSCDVPLCCNPRHLRLGTDADNSADKIARGRQRNARGEQAGNAKLTGEKVLQIRELRKSGRTYRSLALQFGVTYALIGHICVRRAWKHL